MVGQSTFPPLIAFVHAGICPGLLIISSMWWQGPPSNCSRAIFSECVPVRPTPAPTTFSDIESALCEMREGAGSPAPYTAGDADHVTLSQSTLTDSPNSE